MTTKLTLSAQTDVVRNVKRLADQQGTSVSAIFDKFARSITLASKGSRPLGRLTRKASGVIAMPRKKSDRQVLEDALVERYGLS